MSFLKWCARAAAVAGLVIVSVLVPVAAWASSGPGSVAVEAARRRYRGTGGLGALCCLVVVGAIVLVVFLVMRNRRSGPRR